MPWKRISSFVLCNIIFAQFLVNGQTNGTVHMLDLNKFDISIAGRTPSHTNTILLNQSVFLKKFGRPLKFSTEYSEMDEDSVTHYYYEGADAYFIKNDLRAINIESHKYAFQLIDGTSIKVGDNISALNKLIPVLRIDSEPGRVFVPLCRGNVSLDTSLLFEYDIHSGIITSFSIQD